MADAVPVLRVPRSQFAEEIDQRLELGEKLLHIRNVQSDKRFEQLEGEFDTWDEFNAELLRSRFSTAKLADEYGQRTKYSWNGVYKPSLRMDTIRESLREQMRKLISIRQRLGLFDSEVKGPGTTGSLAVPPQGTKVFVVHGHDGQAKLEVAEFLEKITGERPVILHEQADSGRTIIEKFEAHASEAGFAVVLLTADDLGSAKGAATRNARARQNVVLEFGFFIAKLGRSRVVALYEEGVELPSDLSGVLYKLFAGNWHTALAKELQAAEIDIDLGKLV